MEHPCVGHANEWAAQCVVGKPLRQFPGGEPLDQMLLDREVKAQGVAVYEHETWPPEAVVEDERDDAENRSEEHTSELQSRFDLVCRLLLEKKNKKHKIL